MVRILDATIGTELRSFHLETRTWSFDGTVVLSADGKTIAWANRDDGKIYLLDAMTGKPLRTIESTNRPLCLALSIDGTSLAAGGSDQTALVWALSR